MVALWIIRLFHDAHHFYALTTTPTDWKKEALRGTFVAMNENANLDSTTPFSTAFQALSPLG